MVLDGATVQPTTIILLRKRLFASFIPWYYTLEASLGVPELKLTCPPRLPVDLLLALALILTWLTHHAGRSFSPVP